MNLSFQNIKKWINPPPNTLSFLGNYESLEDRREEIAVQNCKNACPLSLGDSAGILFFLGGL